MALLITKKNNHGEDEAQGMEVGNFNVQMLSVYFVMCNFTFVKIKET